MDPLAILNPQQSVVKRRTFEQALENECNVDYKNLINVHQRLTKMKPHAK